MKYYIEVTEVLKKVVCVEAESEKQARSKAEQAYADEVIVLDWDDFDEYSFELCVDQDYYRNEEEMGYTRLPHID